MLALLMGVPFAYAAEEEGSDLEVSGWIPYWRDSEGIKDARRNLSDIDTVHPFAFTVTTKGELRDQAGLTQRDWKSFIRTANRKDVEIIPTVMWSDGASIHNVLSNTSLREDHIEEIARMVERGDYDGVDIDYEGKMAATSLYFSLFLMQLKLELGDKILTCTVEARTPPESLYRVVPPTIQYANDYNVIGSVCDRVEIMAYDQQRADYKLNDEKSGLPYMPVSDADWVEKVIKETIKTIPEEKIMLGAATYGHQYTVSVAPNWYRDYIRVGALNIPDILDIAEENDVTPTRNRAGEMSFSYIPESWDIDIPSSIKAPRNTPKGDVTAARALAYANKTGKDITFNLVWYSDAGAIEDKVELAKRYGLRGVALFKIDGEEDEEIWDLFE